MLPLGNLKLERHTTSQKENGTYIIGEQHPGCAKHGDTFFSVSSTETKILSFLSLRCALCWPLKGCRRDTLGSGWKKTATFPYSLKKIKSNLSPISSREKVVINTFHMALDPQTCTATSNIYTPPERSIFTAGETAMPSIT